MSSCCSGAILYKQVYLLNSNVVYTNHVKFSSDTAPLKSLFHFTSSEYPFSSGSEGPLLGLFRNLYG